MNNIIKYTSIEKELINQNYIYYSSYFQIIHTSLKETTALSRPFSKYSFQSYHSRPQKILQKEKTPSPIFFLIPESILEVAQPLSIPCNWQQVKKTRNGQGTLRRTKQGDVILEIDPNWMIQLVPFTPNRKFSNAPIWNLLTNPKNCQIPIIPYRESQFRDIEDIQEINNKFPFEIDGFFSIQPSSWPGIKKLWYFQIDCPSLEKLRSKYFLHPKLGGHPFLIVVAIIPSKSQQIAAPMFRISPCATAA